MENLVSMIANDHSSTDISDKIKELLYTKSAEKISDFKPLVASQLFGETEEDTNEEE